MQDRHFTRRSFLQAISASAILAGKFAPRQQPNIVMVVVDDQGTNDAGCYGNPVIKTPGLDLLAEHGTRFTHGFCTTASCSASRSVILSGLHNHANGQYGHMHAFHHFKTFDHVQSLPTLLHRAGYRTVRTGKYHVAPPSVYAFEEEITAAGTSPMERADACASIFDQEDGRPFFLYFCTTQIIHHDLYPCSNKCI